MQLPSSHLGRFALLFGTQTVACLIWVCNTRAFVAGDYLWTGITDVLWAGQNLLLIRAIGDRKLGLWGDLGYTAGTVAGSLLAIYLTQRFF